MKAHSGALQAWIHFECECAGTHIHTHAHWRRGCVSKIYTPDVGFCAETLSCPMRFWRQSRIFFMLEFSEGPGELYVGRITGPYCLA